MGAVSGSIGGAGANEKMALGNAANSAKQTIAREARRANQKYARKVITAAISSRNNMFASTAWSTGGRFALVVEAANIFSGWS